MKSSLFASFAAVSVLVLALGFPSAAAAHTRLINPPPLSPDDNAKSGPCGCFFGSPQDPTDDVSPVACPETFSITTLQAGTELTVEWQETVNHDGSFRIAFSPKAPQDVTKADMDGVAMPEMPDTNTVDDAMISQKITVPSEPCELCTIQVRQLMMGSANPYYYTCAAVKIVTADTSSSGTMTPSGGAGGAQGGGGQGASDGGGLGQGGTTGAGMADPPPAVQQGCSAGSSPVPSGGALAIVGLSLAAGLLRKRRRG